MLLFFEQMLSLCDLFLIPSAGCSRAWYLVYIERAVASGASSVTKRKKRLQPKMLTVVPAIVQLFEELIIHYWAQLPTR